MFHVKNVKCFTRKAVNSSQEAVSYVLLSVFEVSFKEVRTYFSGKKVYFG